jgi:hypothetical protein
MKFRAKWNQNFYWPMIFIQAISGHLQVIVFVYKQRVFGVYAYCIVDLQAINGKTDGFTVTD